MALIDLSSKYDVKAECNTPYTVVSHTIEEMMGKDNTGKEAPYEVVVAESRDGKKIGFSGKALVNQFKLLEKKLGGNPYPIPVTVTIAETASKTVGGQPYKVIEKAEVPDYPDEM